MKTSRHAIALVILACLLVNARTVRGQGMPVAMHGNIHALFDAHRKFTRSVEMTKDGYVAITESRDPKLANILREHVSQMRDRLQSGMMVRRWDPAFPELIEHYDDITHRVEATRHGLKITVTGKTPEAIKVAQNHANTVSDFAEHGWKAHDRGHPVALQQPDGSPRSTVPAERCQQCAGEKGEPGKPCYRKEQPSKEGEAKSCPTCRKPSAK